MQGTTAIDRYQRLPFLAKEKKESDQTAALAELRKLYPFFSAWGLARDLRAAQLDHLFELDERLRAYFVQAPPQQRPALLALARTLLEHVWLLSYPLATSRVASNEKQLTQAARRWRALLSSADPSPPLVALRAVLTRVEQHHRWGNGRDLRRYIDNFTTSCIQRGLNSVIHKRPGDSSIYFREQQICTRLAGIYLQLGEARRAAEWYEDAWHLATARGDENVAEPLGQRLRHLYLLLQEPQRGADVLSSSQSPADIAAGSSVLAAFGDLHFCRGEYSLAAQFYQRALDQGGQGNLHLQLGDAHYMEGQYAAAIDQYRQFRAAIRDAPWLRGKSCLQLSKAYFCCRHYFTALRWSVAAVLDPLLTTLRRLTLFLAGGDRQL